MADPLIPWRGDLAAKIQPQIPHAARIWNYWMGGKDNFEADRTAGDAVAAVYPEIVTMAAQSRKFLIRVVHHLAAEAGIDQFLDIGTGLPTMQNTHEVAQQVMPHARIVYVDNDPMVLVHARALLRNTTPQGVTAYVDGDYHEPELIVEDARNVLDFTRPIAVMFMGVLGYVEDFAVMRSIVSRVMDAVPSGSYLVLWDGTDTGVTVNEGSEKLAESGAVPYYLRRLDQLAECFADMELVEPGLVPITRWRPDTDDAPWIDAHGAVARKP
ncbi:SAM-dependent methyltransferase [Streptosporangium sp. NPDC005286]|uniref:SAM-dependent methyltransferase n=1 Tax=Streptosporangium sp. NPDC005286 TaxID=3154463 RepID=UPI0033A34D0F